MGLGQNYSQGREPEVVFLSKLYSSTRSCFNSQGQFYISLSAKQLSKWSSLKDLLGKRMKV